MINFFKYACFSLIIVFACSCREPFDYNLPDSVKNNLVVQGVITDGPGPYTIKLSQAVPFSSNKQVAVKKAVVYVMDDLNNQYDFKERSQGIYYSDSASFRGQLGRAYTLFINTKDGLEYKSTPCLIEPESKIDSIYGFKETFLLYPAGTMNNDNDIYASALHVYADISFGSDQRMSTKVDAALAVENVINEWHFIYAPKYIITINEDSTEIIRTLVPGEGLRIDSFQITNTFYTIKSLNFAPILKTNTDYVSGSKITKIPLGYIQLAMYTDSIDDSTSLTVGGNYILITYASTISNETFNYYYNLSNQIGGKNTFFEPTPVQLIGNIKCINDSTKAAYGLFQANSLVKKYVNISQSGSSYNLQPINGIPPARRDSIVSSTTVY